MHPVAYQSYVECQVYPGSIVLGEHASLGPETQRKQVFERVPRLFPVAAPQRAAAYKHFYCVQLLKRADGLLFLTDARSSLTAADAEAADWVRRNLKRSGLSRTPSLSPEEGSARRQTPEQALHVPIPVVVIANKCDNFGNSSLVASALEAVSLGLGSPVLYSAETQAGTADLYEALQPVVEAAMQRNQRMSGAVPPSHHCNRCTELLDS